MLAKLTSKNQITLPKAIVRSTPAAEYYDVIADAGRIILTPVKLNAADLVREKLAELDITETDIQEAIDWARRQPAE
jgi:hypothetical protein